MSIPTLHERGERRAADRTPYDDEVLVLLLDNVDEGIELSLRPCNETGGRDHWPQDRYPGTEVACLGDRQHALGQNLSSLEFAGRRRALLRGECTLGQSEPGVLRLHPRRHIRLEQAKDRHQARCRRLDAAQPVPKPIKLSTEPRRSSRMKADQAKTQSFKTV